MLPQHKLLEQGPQHGFPFAERETARPGVWHEERLTVTPSPRWTLLVRPLVQALGVLEMQAAEAPPGQRICPASRRVAVH